MNDILKEQLERLAKDCRRNRKNMSKKELKEFWLDKKSLAENIN